jgi:hypothetical protein
MQSMALSPCSLALAVLDTPFSCLRSSCLMCNIGVKFPVSNASSTLDSVSRIFWTFISPFVRWLLDLAYDVQHGDLEDRF